MRAVDRDTSPPLPPRTQKQKATLGGFFVLCRGGEKQGPCGPCAGDSKGCPCRGSPLRIVHLPQLRGGAPEALRAAPKIPANTISDNQFVRITALMPITLATLVVIISTAGPFAPCGIMTSA